MLFVFLKKLWWVFVLAGIILFVIVILKVSENIAAQTDNSFCRNSGILRLAQKTVFFKKAVYWQTRTVKNAGLNDPHYWEAIDRRYGNILGIRKDGSLVYQYFDDDRILEADGYLGNIKITDLAGAARLLQSMRQFEVVISLYENDYLIVWMQSRPINLDLIQRSVALPDFRPPTNIADQIFAKYYWMKLYEQ